MNKLKTIINNKVKEIFTSSLNQQKEIIKNILSNNNNLILNQLKTEYEKLYEQVNQSVKIWMEIIVN